MTRVALLLLVLLSAVLSSVGIRPAEASVMVTLKSYWWNQNPCVMCVKKSWPHCLKSFMGLNGISVMFCPSIVYWECSWAWRLGRRPFDAVDPNVPSV